MAKPNYAFEKRQRDLAKKKKKEEKRLRKIEKGPDLDSDNQENQDQVQPTPDDQTAA